MAGRLSAKGYAAYVMAPAPGAPNLFRVRIGKFTTRADADRVVARLKREERLDPWIVR
jgi:cell division septation protein DedD